MSGETTTCVACVRMFTWSYGEQCYYRERGLSPPKRCRAWTRVPEPVLIALAFAGGTVGAWVGMWLFRHKTAKASFRLKFWLVVAAQVVLVVVFYVWIKPGLA